MKQFPCKAFMVAAFIVCLATLAAHGATVTTISGSYDNWIASSTPNSYPTSFGNDVYGVGSTIARTFLEFDDFSSIPAGQTIVSATLNIYFGSPSNPLAGPIDFYQILTPWTTTTTWNSFNSGGVFGVDYASSPVLSQVGTAPNAQGSPATFDITSLVQAWYSTPASNDGVMLKLNSETSPTYYYFMGSVRGEPVSGFDYSPTLTVTYASAVPEPSSVAMAVMGGLSMLFASGGILRKRRK
ncbi:MAG: DNRLRE domain-containing protein [Chthoniobacterales bacterium]